MQRFHQRENAGAVSIIGLGLVVASIPLTMWWWSRAVWGDFSFSFLDNLAPYVGFSSTPEHPLVGSEVPQVDTTPIAAASTASSEHSATPTRAYCPPGQAPSFVLGFGQLKQRLGATMGDPLECEHVNAANGDTLQQTTTGLAVYRPSSGELQFTDGWRHWALGSSGIVAWAGTDQPPAAPSPTPLASQIDQSTTVRLAQQHATAPANVNLSVIGRIVNTDGVGVVLRSVPQEHARMPKGLLEGAQVQILERSGSEWVRVRGIGSGLEGWVPAQYVLVQ
jgi:hypothetical protein